MADSDLATLPKEIMLLRQACSDLVESAALDEAKDLMDKAQALELYYLKQKDGEAAQLEAGRVVALAAFRIGDISCQLETQPGKRKNKSEPVPQDGTGSKLQILKSIGIRDQKAYECEMVAREIPKAKREAVIAETAKNGRKTVWGRVVKMARDMALGRAKAEWSANEKFPGSAVVTQCEAIPFLEGFAPASIDLLLTDPPYSTEVKDIEAFARSWLTLGLSRVKPTGRAYIFIGAYPIEIGAYWNAFDRPDRKSAAHSMTFKMILPWHYKNTIGPNTNDYMLNWQACLYFKGPDAAKLNTEVQNEKGSVHEVGNEEGSVQQFNAPDGRHGIRLHEFEKPPELAELFLRHATMPGDKVVDPFAGTGTFLAAAARLGRNAIGCEISEKMIQFCIQKNIKYEP